MSRYELEPVDSNHRVVVGWDRMLDTYFAKVDDKAALLADEESSPVLWVGASDPRITDIDELKRLVKPYASISLKIEMALLLDSTS